MEKENKIVLCKDCKHCMQRYTKTEDFRRCKMSRVSYSGNEPHCFRYASEVNRDGRCAMFEPGKMTTMQIIANFFENGY